MRKEKVDVIVCSCNSPEHNIIIFKDWEENLVYCNVSLSNHGFWTRLVRGVKYIFGYKSKYGHYDEIILDDTHIPTLRRLINVLTPDNERPI